MLSSLGRKPRSISDTKRRLRSEDDPGSSHKRTNTNDDNFDATAAAGNFSTLLNKSRCSAFPRLFFLFFCFLVPFSFSLSPTRLPKWSLLFSTVFLIFTFFYLFFLVSHCLSTLHLYKTKVIYRVFHVINYLYIPCLR